MADKIIAKILKYDPTVDDSPEYKTYEMDWVDDGTGIMTALQVLHAINYDEEEIGYDYCCRSNLCGRCSIMIDGNPRLACWTPVSPGEHTFEPLKGFPVIKDLIVDRSRAYERFVNADVSIKTIDPIVNMKDIDYDLYWNTLERLNMCRECMCCYTVCPVLDMNGWQNFAGPGALMAVAQRYLDTVDESDRLLQAVTMGLFECIDCGSCTEVCSSHISIAEIIGQMKNDAEARGIKPQGDVEFM